MSNQNIIITAVAVIALAIVGYFFFLPGSGPADGGTPPSATTTQSGG